MITLNAPKGLGDALYVRAVALHLAKNGHTLAIITRWPDVFHGIDAKILDPGDVVTDSHKDMRHVHDRYTQAARYPSSDHFVMCCRNAGIEDRVELTLQWAARNSTLVETIKREARGRKILVYQPFRQANNEHQKLLRPTDAALIKVLNEHREYFIVKLGKDRFTLDDKKFPCHMDLFDKTTITDAFDIGAMADLVVGEHCFILIMAEAMDKQFVYLISRRAAKCGYEWLRTMASPWMIHKKHLATTVYDE